MTQTLHIRNMVCNRCIAAVQQLLEGRGYPVRALVLGEATIEKGPLSAAEKENLRKDLETAGFGLIDDRSSQLIEGIRTTVINLVHHSRELPREKYSELLSAALHTDYGTLSRLFSETEGITIEQYIILQKIERVKGLLVYGELRLGDIALQLGYSSTAHLSAQFRKVTGMTPTAFRGLQEKGRRPLDEIGGTLRRKPAEDSSPSLPDRQLR